MKNAIYTTLKNAGFDVEPFGKFMIVGLNRKVSISEVWAAINCEGDTVGWINSDGKVWDSMLKLERRSLELTPEQWLVLEQIAKELNATAPTGPNANNPSWRTLIKQIADKSLSVEKHS